MVLAVSHKQYIEMPLNGVLASLNPGGVIVDVKSALDRKAITNGGHPLWRL